MSTIRALVRSVDIGSSPTQEADRLTQREERTGSGSLALSTDFWPSVLNSFLISVGDTGCRVNTNYHPCDFRGRESR